ncbi:MAG TPA: hypothetical protein VGF99_21380 [Myxococcota bacterium]
MPFVVVAVMSALAAQAVPPDWSCDPERWADGQCDCGCAALDEADCASAAFTACDRSNCVEGQVPWAEHNPGCMAGECGDAWKDDDEACDDDRGCADDCGAILDGFFCGDGAAGCVGGEVTVEDETPEPAEGCSSTGTPLLMALLGLLRRRQPRRR